MIEYDPLHPPNWQNPYPTYARLRDEAPVHYAEQTGTDCISRYADVARVMRDPESFSSAAAFAFAAFACSASTDVNAGGFFAKTSVWPA